MKLVQRVKALESASNGMNASSASNPEMESKVAILLKERDAVCTIMEQKIKVLVQHISNALVAANNGDSAAGEALNKDVGALQRLVNASVVALKSASSPKGGSSTNSVPNSAATAPKYQGAGANPSSASDSRAISAFSSKPQFSNQPPQPASAFSASNGGLPAQPPGRYPQGAGASGLQPVRKPPPPPGGSNSNLSGRNPSNTNEGYNYRQ